MKLELSEDRLLESRSVRLRFACSFFRGDYCGNVVDRLRVRIVECDVDYFIVKGDV